uniref:Uncharacterized protein n=1 Tax=Candidatus Kentrum sp. TC TaxID=2126339 RepID=A0A450Y721_9GAMM|nr:MAG: hypothetical protein BECKTC1821D_GA0114238_100119 [Candidatus Kentron sp. TC]VFK37776.1 MAG: hypothetical protein BECKTC1821E_GA0114239_100196 [Candidatus Kentron sp. TC]VFK51403.1 MAG: hypothetical protein BECKTC1821F_GA0114240_100181 [Candidatus Kentron sp. TC]
MKQEQLNRITELVCGIVNGYVQFIPASYPIFHYACNVLQFAWAVDANLEQLTRARTPQRGKEDDSDPEPIRKMDSSLSSEPRQPQPKLQPRPLVFIKEALLSELPAEHRCWTGNDANKRGYNGRIPAGENPVYLELHWRKDSKASRKLVGGFILDVTALEKEGYLVGLSDGDIRVRLMREPDGRVYVGRSVEKRIPIGEVST